MSFDFLAPHYRWMEAVLAGRVLQRARVCWLEKLQGRRHVLIVGEGPGRLLEAIMKRFPDAEVTVVEQSARMIEVAKRRLTARGVLLENVRWVCTDVRTWTVSVGGCGGFDAVLTPFVLDCFSCETVELLVAELSALAKRDAVWLVTDFQVPPHGWRRMRAKAVHTMMYRLFRVATRLEASRLSEPDEALKREGFVLKGRKVFNAGLVRSDWWERA